MSTFSALKVRYVVVVVVAAYYYGLEHYPDLPPGIVGNAKII